MNCVAIVGGGYTGTAFAIHLSRAAPSPLNILVTEPRKRVGGGLAHSTEDPNHRLNAPDDIHLLYPDDSLHFRSWLEDTGRLRSDPEAWCADGQLYPRRGDFGAYLTAQFETHARHNPSASILTHIRQSAVSVERRDGWFRIGLGDGDSIEAGRCVIAVGPDSTAIPAALAGAKDLGDRLIADPLRPGALTGIQRDANLLILGTGLTAADAVATLVGQGHEGVITCLSRHGLRPQGQAPPPDVKPAPLWDRMAVQPPPFVQRHGLPGNVRRLMHIVRSEVRARIACGEPWHGAVDDIRDAADELWRALDLEEKRRFLRHVKPYYDSHRFRIPPQTQDILTSAERRGLLNFCAGRILRVEPVSHRLKVVMHLRGQWRTQRNFYDAIVCCLGFSRRVLDTINPFLQSCLRSAIARPSDMGRGLDVDQRCRVIAADGRPVPGLYALGAMTLDRLGEPPAAIFILREIFRTLPGFLEATGPANAERRDGGDKVAALSSKADCREPR
jgi:uncharacterized NAD(P)/FAD-binding protein YdhS